MSELNVSPSQADNKPAKIYFSGLNALRFFAASLVVLMHLKSNQGRMGLPTLPDFGLFAKGITAVSFFFVLSGFLITYLLLQEIRDTRRVNVKGFYIRRVFRIWPLYFFVIGFGCLFYWVMVPQLGLDFKSEYNKGLALFLYVFFGANLMNSLYHVGGMLHVTWSIAVEEQFYLIWAPIVRRLKNNIRPILWAVLIGSSAIAILNLYNVFRLMEPWQVFVHTMQFHYMAMGGLFAHSLFFNRERLMNSVFFRSKPMQVFLLATLLSYILFYVKNDFWEPLLVIPQGLLFAWLILNVSSNPRGIQNLDIPVLNYLGKISYGIYMFHMIVVYFSSFVLMKLTMLHGSPFFQVLHLGLVFGVTILVSGLSYRLIEKGLIKRGSKLSKQFEESGQSAKLAKAA